MAEESKKARRDYARETARIMREEEKKRRRRNRILTQVGVVVGAVAVALIVVLVVQSSIKPPIAGPANMASDGIVLTGDGTGEIVGVETKGIPIDGKPTPTDTEDYADTVNIVVYVDYMCPFCRAFEQTNAETIGTWVSQGLATVEYHPIAILDNVSQGTKYSSRAASAMACVAAYQPDSFFQANAAMFSNQPPESTSGLTNEEIASVIAQAGVTDVDVVKCITDERYVRWAADATERTKSAIPNSSLERIGSTPTVLVNGEQYTGAPDDAAAFQAFVSEIGLELAPETEEEPGAETE
jgi:protein-disulfide isomerase